MPDEVSKAYEASSCKIILILHTRRTMHVLGIILFRGFIVDE